MNNHNKKIPRLIPVVLLGAALGGCAILEHKKPDNHANAISAHREAAPATPSVSQLAAEVATTAPPPNESTQPLAVPVDRASQPATPAEPLASTQTAERVPDANPSTDLWERLRAGMTLTHHDHARIDAEVDWYARHPNYLDRVSQRASRYLYFIAEAVNERGLPADLALLPVVESAFQPFAYSHGRAAGIWQFIPGTGRRYGLKQNWWYDGRRDIYAATQAALDYLEDLHRNLNGDWLLALAAYNSGEGTVRKAIQRNRRAGKPTDFWSLRLPRETRSYVPRLLAIAKVVENPQQYELSLDPMPNTPYFQRVGTGGQIDLALAAEMAGISVEELYLLNPAFNRWATAPEGPHYLLLPVASISPFEEQLRQLPDEKRMQWVRHRIRDGETLGHIARRYKTTVPTLQRINHLRGTSIRAGKALIIPVASKSAATYALSAAQRKRSIVEAPKSGRHKTIHIVKSGDTLWDIAQAHGVSVRRLAAWNAMAPRDTLRLGQKLVIWTTPGHGGQAAGLQKVSLPAHGSVIQRVTYKVRRGDSLARIAQRFRVTVKDLLRWNSLSKDRYLQPGQAIKLFVDITRQTGT